MFLVDLNLPITYHTPMIFKDAHLEVSLKLVEYKISQEEADLVLAKSMKRLYEFIGEEWEVKRICPYTVPSLFEETE